MRRIGQLFAIFVLLQSLGLAVLPRVAAVHEHSSAVLHGRHCSPGPADVDFPRPSDGCRHQDCCICSSSRFGADFVAVRGPGALDEISRLPQLSADDGVSEGRLPLGSARASASSPRGPPRFS
jgi:hypothetical protein